METARKNGCIVNYLYDKKIYICCVWYWFEVAIVAFNYKYLDLLTSFFAFQSDFWKSIFFGKHFWQMQNRSCDKNMWPSIDRQCSFCCINAQMNKNQFTRKKTFYFYEEYIFSLTEAKVGFKINVYFRCRPYMTSRHSGQLLTPCLFSPSSRFLSTNFTKSLTLSPQWPWCHLWVDDSITENMLCLLNFDNVLKICFC